MMHGREKSGLAIVAMKPANKAKKVHRGGVCGGGRSGVGGAKGGDQGECGLAWHAPDTAPGERAAGAGTHTAGGKRMLCRHAPEVGAVCGKAARTDLGGGREVTRVPTAKAFFCCGAFPLSDVLRTSPLTDRCYFAYVGSWHHPGNA